jgi:hypothetical protein
MMHQILGEALNVGCVLLGSLLLFSEQFLKGKINKLSTADNLMRYDLEVSRLLRVIRPPRLLRLKRQDTGTKKIED